MPLRILPRTTPAFAASILLLSACTSPSAATGPVTTASAEVTTVGVTASTTTTTSAGTSNSVPDGGGVDLDGGFAVLNLADQARSLWVVPLPSSEGCDGMPAYSLWSVAELSTEPVLAASSVHFFGVPVLHSTPFGGVVMIDRCNGASDVYYAELGDDGVLSEERQLTAGDAKGGVAAVYYDEHSGNVVFELDDSAENPTLVWVYPPTGAVDRSIVLGEPTSGCSASDLTTTLEPDPAIPAPVAAKRQAIVEAAVACDFDALEALTGDDFLFQSDNVYPGPAYAWAQREQLFGEPILETLVLLLQLQASAADDGSGETWYGWPEAFVHAPGAYTDAAKRQLVAIGFEAEHAERIVSGEADYVWFRIGMNTDGDWRFFLAGD